MAGPAKIRPPWLAEVSALSALAYRSKAYWGYDEKFMAACRGELEVPISAFGNETIRVADIDGKIAGYYRLAADEHIAEIEALFVDPVFMGRGIGRLLWADLIARFRAMKAATLLCQSDPYAEGFYLAMGMRRLGERESASVPGRFLPLLSLKSESLASEAKAGLQK